MCMFKRALCIRAMQDWPSLCTCTIKYLDESEEEPVWKEERFEIINMIATNLSSLGVDHPITDGMHV